MARMRDGGMKAGQPRDIGARWRGGSGTRGDERGVGSDARVRPLTASRIGLGPAARAVLGHDRGGNRRGWRVGLHRWDGGQREGAGLPEQDELFKAAEQARQGRHDEGMEGGRQPAMLLLRLSGVAQRGEGSSQG